MIRPPYLKSGDRVAIIATAKKIAFGDIKGAIELIESWGLKPMLGQHLYQSFNQFAGTDEQRAYDLQWALNNPDIKAVLFARGGYGTVRIIDRIDWSSFAASPKWLCGFSDLTVLHSHVLENVGVETLHSSMPIFFKDGIENTGSQSLQSALFGKSVGLEWISHELNKNGTASGQIVGGNLSVLYSITDSVSDIKTDGKILFLEDLTENLYHIDRMVMQLKRAGKFKNLAGLVVGQFTDLTDNEVPFGQTVEEIVLDAVKDYSFPVAFNAPIGHVAENEAVFHGRNCLLTVSESTSLSF